MVTFNKWTFGLLCLLFLVMSFGCCMFMILFSYADDLVDKQNEALEILSRERLDPQLVRMAKGFIFMFDARAYKYPKKVQLLMLENGKPFLVSPFQNNKWSIAFFVPNEHMSMRYSLIIEGKAIKSKPQPGDVDI